MPPECPAFAPRQWPRSASCAVWSSLAPSCISIARRRRPICRNRRQIGPASLCDYAAIWDEPGALSFFLGHGQLMLQPFDADKTSASSIPAEDIGLVSIDHPQVTYTHGAFQTLLEHGAVVLFCDRHHLPMGLLIPLSTQTQQVTRLRLQIQASKPLCKRLWQQIVVTKIQGQASLYPTDSTVCRHLRTLTKEVKSGDTTNVKAQAAKSYWAAWREEFSGFRRDTNGKDSINAQLNYGYAVIRASVARALVAAGLHTALGIHHSNRSNAFCLADDLLEPLRPISAAHVSLTDPAP